MQIASKIAIGLLILLALAAVMMILQHNAFQSQRRKAVRDLQPAFYSGKTFYVVAFVDLDDTQDLIGAVSKLLDALTREGSGKLIYAGEVVINALESEQLATLHDGRVNWDAVLLIQFDSKDAYENARALAGTSAAVSAFNAVHWHGLKRPAIRNLMLPQLLGFRRHWRNLTGKPKLAPFPPAPPPDLETRQGMVQRALSEVAETTGQSAIVIVNLTQAGSVEQQKADAHYLAGLFDVMAEVNHGPMHVGSAVALESGGDFDQVALVYYPGAAYFRDMTASDYYLRLLPDKQVADTQASITVPLLDRLRSAHRESLPDLQQSGSAQ